MQNVWTYYIEGLMRQGNAALARKYLGLGSDDVATFGYVVNSTPLWQDVRIPLSGTGPGSQPPTFNTDFLPGIRTWRFNNIGDGLHTELQLPHGFNKSTALGIRLHVHWSAQTNIAALAQRVGWSVDISAANLHSSSNLDADGVFQAAATYTGFGATTAAFKHMETDLVTLTKPYLASLVDLQDSAVLLIHIYRSSGAPNNYAGNDVFGISLDAHYVAQQMGSVSEFP